MPAASIRSPAAAGTAPMRECRSTDRCRCVAAASAAARMHSADGICPSSVRLACSASIGRSPTLRSAIRAPAQRPLIVELDGHRHTDERKIAVTPRDLLKRKTAAFRGWRNTNLRQQLARLEGCREEPDEKIRRGHLSHSRLPVTANRRIQRKHHGRQLGSRIGMRQAAADRAAIADGRMRDVRHRLGNQRNAAGNQAASFDRALTGHAANRQARLCRR